MALSSTDAFGAVGKRRSRRGRGRRGALSEINVTPLVDVMLVLLIIFMISAPLLTSGVAVELPKTEAGSLQDQAEPITITVRRDGKLFIGESEVAFAALKPRLASLARGGLDKPVFVRGDRGADWEVMAQVMAALQSGGFSKINLITDTGGPSSGRAPAPDPEAAAD
ncbi:MAG: ExbD/TolR family protein [Pseudomonadota bacterium]